MEYEDFIRLVNGDRFSYALFEVSGYAHYKRCTIQKRRDDHCKGHWSIDVILSSCPTEKVSFMDHLKESYKFFYLGRKLGTQTLKQVWNKIVIHEIREQQEDNAPSDGGENDIEQALRL